MKTIFISFIIVTLVLISGGLAFNKYSAGIYDYAEDVFNVKVLTEKEYEEIKAQRSALIDMSKELHKLATHMNLGEIEDIMLGAMRLGYACGGSSFLSVAACEQKMQPLLEDSYKFRELPDIPALPPLD